MRVIAGNAHPVVLVDEQPEGGDAIPVYLVNVDETTLAVSGGRTIRGGNAIKMVSVTDRPVRAGAALPVFALNLSTENTLDGRNVIGGSAIPVYVVNPFPPSPPPTPSTLLDDLAFAYMMGQASGSRLDSSIGGNTLTAEGAAPGGVVFFSHSPNANGYSVSLCDQYTQRLYRASTADLQGTGTFTCNVWIFGTMQDVVFSKILGTTNEYMLFSSGGNLIWRIYTNGGAGFYDAAIANPSNGAWHHIVCERNAVANTISIQVDGGSVTTTNTVGSIVGGDSPFVVGNYHTGTLWFNGLITLLEKRNRLLTAQERTDLFKAPLFPYSTIPSTINPRIVSSFPVMLRTASGTFRVYWNNGNDHSLTNNIIRQVSSTNFTTWTHGPNLEAKNYQAVVSICQLANGDILRFCQDGLAPTLVTKVFRSDDDGDTWDGGSVVTTGLSSWGAPFGIPKQLAGGDLLLSIYGENTGEATRAGVLTSPDNGANFSLLATIAYDETYDFTELDIEGIGGNNFVSIIRTELANTATNQNFRFATSSDNCATWSALGTLTFGGKAPKIIFDGTTLWCFYTNISSTRVSYRKSVDGGATWGAENVLYTDFTPDTGYIDVVLLSGVFYMVFHRSAGFSIVPISKTAASM